MLKAKPQHQEWDSDEEDECKNIWQEVQTKWVAFSHPAETPKTKLDELDELAQRMHGLDIGNAA
jgi:hypothetical protein